MKKFLSLLFDRCRNFFLSIGPNCRIGSSKVCLGFRPSRIYKTIIGDNSFVGRNLYSSVPLIISDYVMIAPNVSFVGADHDLSLNLDFEMIQMPRLSATQVVVKQGAWIGCSSIIMHVITVGHGSVVGAGSVVTKDVPDYSIVVGNPAKLLRLRS